jgi:sarcosine oxidase/L-pipecolate oxidase
VLLGGYGADLLFAVRPKGDFIISYHPDHEGLFLATGGSGHAFKFLPVIGDKVVDALEGTLDSELREMWTWSAAATADNEDFDGDGSRSGARRANLKDELAKTQKASRSSAL